jgi:hypothetical protein
MAERELLKALCCRASIPGSNNINQKIAAPEWQAMNI